MSSDGDDRTTSPALNSATGNIVPFGSRAPRCDVRAVNQMQVLRQPTVSVVSAPVISPRQGLDGEQKEDADTERRRIDTINNFDVFYQRGGMKAVKDLLLEIGEGFKAREARRRNDSE